MLKQKVRGFLMQNKEHNPNIVYGCNLKSCARILKSCVRILKSCVRILKSCVRILKICVRILRTLETL
jgi:hypothetical protein